MKESHPTAVRPSRRDLITARFSRTSFHVASLVVQAWPERIAGLTLRLNGLDGVEVHKTGPGGRMILTVEVADDARLLRAISDIEGTDGVITASLVYHQIEDEDHE
ncbi:MAG: glutamate synthase [Rhodospirillaceae bacterium]|jgi:nitrate reductase NapD|nr:glutamate synthase [Rhodospirillaceae bacterium]|tara:strand:+ start:1726 stop:2043 length:318 start_codon:yes stop_codon:yes gene_type:complete